MWVRLLSTGEIATLVKFQFTHPCGCDLLPCFPGGRPAGFNSRTRVGATRLHNRRSYVRTVSIHAPVWVRPECHPQSDSLGSFNSRTRVGATDDSQAPASWDYVSIHAPVWVRQASLLVRCRESGVSIHAPVWVRQVFDKVRKSANLFQFTHPCGCDLIPEKIRRPVKCFNSRTRVGATTV